MFLSQCLYYSCYCKLMFTLCLPVSTNSCVLYNIIIKVLFEFLLSRLQVIQVIGKRSRPVPILLTGDMTESMTILNDMRSQCCVHGDNRFFFALPGTSGAHLQFFSVLQRVATSAQLKKPQNLTTTRLRKHLATVAQVLTDYCMHLALCTLFCFEMENSFKASPVY